MYSVSYIFISILTVVTSFIFSPQKHFFGSLLGLFYINFLWSYSGLWKTSLLFNFVENLSTPVIAAVNGFALGGGLELAMACHFRVASDNAKMGLPEVTLGVIPGYGGTQRLPQLVGKGRAMEMIMSAAMIDAETAKNYGLVNHVVPQQELLEFTKGIATKITRNSSVAIAKAIEAVNANYEDGVNGFETEIKNFGACFGTEDFKEGTTAFLEKRKAVFPGK